MSKFVIPDVALSQHIAVLGKTGSGKTSTAKLIIEHVVAEGSRVCVLDPIKSDWWGLTSSADGKRAGLPFYILGGPHAHLPLHDGAGKAIAEVVANGSLRLSVLDMADFEPGGQAKFFKNFAPMLLKKMKGVLYLVIEEAHLFAPKERSGFGDENMAIHWAKTLATAGRTKGIRMMVLTQRTQALHNALLGSCDTMIACRMTAPADQEPVVKWLKSNVKDKEIIAQVDNSLGDLKTGTGWLCSGEAKLHELVKFPRIRTYDNTATPTGDGEDVKVKTASVDQDKLREIIGTAVQEAQANDPAALKKRIAELERLQKAGAPASPAVSKADLQAAEQRGYERGRAAGATETQRAVATHVRELKAAAHKALEAAFGSIPMPLERHRNATTTGASASIQLNSRATPAQPARSAAPARLQLPPAPATRGSNGEAASGDVGTGGKRRILTALAQYPDGMNQRKLSILVDIAPKGGTWRTYMAELRGRGLIEGRKDHLRITDAGLQALGHYDPLPTGEALIEYWRQRLGDSGKRAIFDVVVEAYPGAIDVDAVSQKTGISREGGTWRTYLAELRGLGIVEGRGELRAAEDLF